jgi:hypothetical protein
VSPSTSTTSARPPISSLESGEDDPAEVAAGRLTVRLFAACLGVRAAFVAFFFGGAVRRVRGRAGAGGEVGETAGLSVLRTGAGGGDGGGAGGCTRAAGGGGGEAGGCGAGCGDGVRVSGFG